MWIYDIFDEGESTDHKRKTFKFFNKKTKIMMQKYPKIEYTSAHSKKVHPKNEELNFLYSFSASYPQYFITASSIQLGINFLLLIQSFQSQKKMLKEIKETFR